MVAYTVETLVHLYDSLNSQIESVQNDLNDFIQVSFSPDLGDEAITEIEAAHLKAEKRLEKLTKMREQVENLLGNILDVEVNE